MGEDICKCVSNKGLISRGEVGEGDGWNGMGVKEYTYLDEIKKNYIETIIINYIKYYWTK